MNFQTLLFDVDDTLLDFQAAEDQALQRLFREKKVAWSPAIKEAYQQVNQQLWRDYELGKISRNEVTDTRFGKFFATLNQRVDSPKMDQQYRSYLAQGSQLLANSREIVADLAQKADLYIVTNGVSDTQRNRLTKAGLLPYFKDIFVSEETGYQKPMKEFFDYVFQRIPNFKASETVIIGDSLTSDIQGGQGAGIATVWLNPEQQPLLPGITPTYEIRQLAELYQILGSDNPLANRKKSLATGQK